MPDAVQKSFVRSFIDYLKKQVDAQTMAPDALESVEVAIQCLAAAFDVGEEEVEMTAAQTTTASPGGDEPSGSNTTGASVSTKNIDMFELFQSLYIERNPESLALAETIKNEGNRLMKDGKFNEALLQYNRAINFDPKNPIFYCNRAAAYIRLGDNDRAVTDCKSALVYNNNYSKAYCRLGVAYSNMGKYTEAEQAYAKAIELEPDNVGYRNNLEVARNARNAPEPDLTQLTHGLETMLSSPNVRNLFNNVGIDLSQLQSMSQNPMVMNTIRNLLATNSTGAAAGAGNFQPQQNDLMTLFQAVASQLMTQQEDGTPGGPGTGGGGGNNPPPSST